MAECSADTDEDNKLADERQEEEEQEDGEANAALLAGLNLVLVLSFFSLSPEECSNLDEIEETESANYDRRGKHGVSRSGIQTRKQQVSQCPAVARQASKFQTKIRDSRHCRRF